MVGANNFARIMNSCHGYLNDSGAPSTALKYHSCVSRMSGSNTHAGLIFGPTAVNSSACIFVSQLIHMASL